MMNYESLGDWRLELSRNCPFPLPLYPITLKKISTLLHLTPLHFLNSKINTFVLTPIVTSAIRTDRIQLDLPQYK
jgi:hypothetical protein